FGPIADAGRPSPSIVTASILPWYGPTCHAAALGPSVTASLASWAWTKNVKITVESSRAAERRLMGTSRVDGATGKKRKTVTVKLCGRIVGRAFRKKRTGHPSGHPSFL